MTTTEAAELIGISTNQVRLLVRKGKIKARLVTINGHLSTLRYEVDKRSAEKYRDNPPDPRGWKRGRSRK